MGACACGAYAYLEVVYQHVKERLQILRPGVCKRKIRYFYLWILRQKRVSERPETFWNSLKLFETKVWNFWLQKPRYKAQKKESLFNSPVPILNGPRVYLRVMQYFP